MSRDPQTLVARMLGGDRLALAQLITHVENRTDAVPTIMAAVYPRAGAFGGAGGPRIARPARTTRRAALTAEDPLRNMGWRRPHVHP